MAQFTITIAAGAVASNLIDFPLMVRLSDMSSAFWAAVKEDGGDIRATDMAGATIPHDLSRFDYSEQDGVLWVKITLAAAADNSFKITCGNSGLSKLAVDDTNGRNAVWSDYEAVFLLGESGAEDRTGGANGAIELDPQSGCFELVATSPDLNSHQGICWDGTHYYTTDTNAIYKWDAAWSLVDSNVDPLGDAAIGGAPTVNHLGDVEFHAGLLYMPIECYPASVGLYNAHIGIFDAADLSFVGSFDISAQAHEASSVTYCDLDGLFYVTDYDSNPSTIFKYDPSDGSYVGTLTCDRSIGLRQGITWWRGSFWVSSASSNEVLKVSYAGEVSVASYASALVGGLFGNTTTATYEGIGHTDTELLLLDDPGSSETVARWRPIDLGLAGGGGFSTAASGFVSAYSRSSHTTFTLGVTASIAVKGANRVAASYWQDGIDNRRQVIAYRNASAALAMWDVNNSWLDSSPAINPTLNQPYRLNSVYSGSASRKLFINGAQAAVQNVITAVPATLNAILIGTEDSSHLEGWSGTLGFVYLRAEALSAAWLAAEYANLNDSISFYSIVDVPPPPRRRPVVFVCT